MSKTTTVDFSYHHPCTCIVAGPTGCGKSTFVRNLLLHRSDLIDKEFDYIFIFMGTNADENETLSNLIEEIPNKISIFELKNIYDDSTKDFENNFQRDFDNLVLKEKKGLNGCVIFDDLMKELTSCNMLVNLFTKYSSHAKISTIHITQNPFFQGPGKKQDNATLYRNTKIFVLFKNPMDSSVLRIIASRLSEGKASLIPMLTHILDKYRYVVMRGDFNLPPEAKFTADIFNSDPVPHLKSYQLESNN